MKVLLLSALQQHRFTIVESVWSGWQSVQPTNRISPHYSAHVFSGPSASRRHTIGDKAKDHLGYPHVERGLLARYQRENNDLFSKIDVFKRKLSDLWPAQRARHTTATLAGRKPRVCDAMITSQKTDDN